MTSSPLASAIYTLLEWTSPMEESKGMRKNSEWLNWGLETVSLNKELGNREWSHNLSQTSLEGRG